MKRQSEIALKMAKKYPDFSNMVKHGNFCFWWWEHPDLIKDITNYLKDSESIADLGYSGGNLIEKLRSIYPNKDYVAVDLYRPLDKEIEKRVRSVAMVSDVENLPFVSESVDGIVSTFTFEYVDKGKFMKELTRVLKTNGKVAFTFHNNANQIVRGAREIYEETGLSYFKDFANQLEKNMFHNLKEIEEFISSYGLKVEDSGIHSTKYSRSDVGKRVSRDLCYFVFAKKS
jgi:ubiquinone/menaquinone biosynthesis C-methylase UbiE